MKRYVTIIFLFVTSILSAQTKTVQDIFNPAEPITWLGIDFSKAKFVGDAGRLINEAEMQEIMYKINALMLAEPDKFDMAGALDRLTVKNALDVTFNKNKTLDGMSMRVLDKVVPEILPRTALDEIVQSYDFGDHDGIGVMINIDQFNKFTVKGSMWVTFIDMRSKKVLLADHFKGTAQGFGIRNFWASTIYGTIKAMKRGAYKHWRKKNKANA